MGKRTHKCGEPLPPLSLLKQCSCKKGQTCRIVNLLMYEDHYYGIVNINRVLNFGTHLAHRVWCDRCIRPFYSKEKLERHRVACYQAMRQVEIMPRAEESDYYFKNWQATMSPLFVCYADSECMLLNTEVENLMNGGAHQLQKHTACALGYIIIPHRH